MFWKMLGADCLLGGVDNQAVRDDGSGELCRQSDDESRVRQEAGGLCSVAQWVLRRSGSGEGQKVLEFEGRAKNERSGLLYAQEWSRTGEKSRT